jgi:hypothetical protein
MFAVFPELIFSQFSHGLFMAENYPQNSQINPAVMLHGDNAFFIGIPLINRIDNEIRSSFKYDDYLTYRDDSLYLNPEGLLNSLKDQNILSENTTINLLYLGIKSGDNEFRFGMSFKSAFYNQYSKNFLSLFLLGNEQFVGKTTDFSGNNSSSTIYQEIFFSYSRKISPELSIGITPKFLIGNMNFNIEKADFTLKIDEDTYVHSGSADIKINTSVDAQSFSEFYDNLDRFGRLGFTNNLGYAIDLGVKYNPLSNLSFAASLVDLGRIKWNEPVKNYEIKTDSASFEGIFLENIFDDKTFTGNLTDKLFDELKENFDFTETENAYHTNLVPKITFSGTYTFFDKNKAAIIYYGELFDQRAISSFSINYMRQIGSFLNLGINYYNFDFTSHNLGFTVLINAGALQLYFATNSIVGMINPQHTNLYNVNFGVNLVFNKHKNVELIDETGE